MAAVQREPIVPGAPMGFTVLRVPFFLEPDYSTDEEFEETNRVRLIRKWGGKAGWEDQKRRHRLKERGREVGIQHCNLDRIASSTVASHRLVQWVTKTLGVNKAEQMYADLNSRHFEDGQKLNDKTMLTEVAANVGMYSQHPNNRPSWPRNNAQQSELTNFHMISVNRCRSTGSAAFPGQRPGT